MTKPRRSAAIAAVLTAGAVSTASLRMLSSHPPGGANCWLRVNYRGREVRLLGGPALAAGALAVAARQPGAFVAGATGALLGVYDDLCGDEHARGLRGHWQALRRGRLTTGLIKLVGLSLGGAVAAAFDRRSAVDVAIDVALIAGTANLLNLLDLRPGRALKVATIVAIPLAASPAGDGADVAAGVLGAVLALLPADLAETVMIGDCGANAAGALVGWSAAASMSRRGRLAATAGVVALTAASEQMSFTDVITRTPTLAALDAWGRRAQ